MTPTTGGPTHHPARTSTAGPRLLTFGGVAALALGAVGLVLAAQSFVGLLPLGILTADGTAGSDVVATVPAPGSTEVVLEGSTDYALYLARPEAAEGGLDGRVVVEGPGGEVVDVAGSADVSVHTSRGGIVANTVGSFTTAAAGTYTLVAPAMSDDVEASVLVAPDRPVLPFVGGILGTIAGVLVAGVLGALGLGMVIGGALWWHVRRRARSAATVV
jgi:hypothetical protein